MGLLVGFALAALLLALVGVFGVIAWSVAQRSREIGIRMALGAQRSQVQALFLRYGLKLTCIGLASGILASFALRRTLANLVFDVSPADPAIYILVSVLMLLVAFVACYLPARRAANVDPLLSMRHE
jgi:ABC-type antimicrobial peptide transport system permease subunit